MDAVDIQAEEDRRMTRPDHATEAPAALPQPPFYNDKENGPESGPPEALTALVHQPDAGELLLPVGGRRMDENPAAVYLAGLSAGSRRTMRGALNTIAGLLTNGRVNDGLEIDWSHLRFTHTAAIRSLLAEHYSHATANRMLSALRGALKAAWRLEQMTAEEYQRACDVTNVLGETLPAGRAVAAGELIGLMSACAKTERLAGARDAAMLGLLYGCGLRRAELVALDLADYEPGAEPGMGALKVQGKRNKARRVPVVDGAAEALTDWLTVRGSAAGPLFVRIRKSDQMTMDRLTTQAVYHILGQRVKEAGLSATCSPHDMRRTFIGDLLDAGADIATVQKLAGHSNVTTTARYDRRGEATKRKAAKMLHVPYFRAHRRPDTTAAGPSEPAAVPSPTVVTVQEASEPSTSGGEIAP